MAEAKGRPFHSFLDGELKAIEDWRKLPWVRRMLLVDLLRTAKWDHGVHRTTLAELAERMDMRPETVAGHLEALATADLIDCDFPRGHKGTVVLTCYDRVMVTSPLQDDAQRSEHARVRAARRKARARADKRKAG